MEEFISCIIISHLGWREGSMNLLTQQDSFFPEQGGPVQLFQWHRNFRQQSKKDSTKPAIALILNICSCTCSQHMHTLRLLEMGRDAGQPERNIHKSLHAFCRCMMSQSLLRILKRLLHISLPPEHTCLRRQ